MALATYTDLKAAIATWLVRVDLTTPIVDAVALAEAEIRKDVRCQAMETLATGTLTGETLDFPTGFIWAKRIKVGRYVREYRSQADYADLATCGGTHYVFTIIGQKIYILNGANGDDYSLIYWKSFTAFSTGSDTNWLLTNHPDVYLWGGCKYGSVLLRDDVGVAKFDGLYQAAVRKVNRNEWMAGVSGAPLRVTTAASAVV